MNHIPDPGKKVSVLAEMYAEKHGIIVIKVLPDGRACLGGDRLGEYVLLTDLNICFEILEWWKKAQPVNTCRSVFISMEFDDWMVEVREVDTITLTFNVIADVSNSSLPTAIAECLYKMRGSHE